MNVHQFALRFSNNINTPCSKSMQNRFKLEEIHGELHIFSNILLQCKIRENKSTAIRVYVQCRYKTNFCQTFKLFFRKINWTLLNEIYLLICFFKKNTFEDKKRDEFFQNRIMSSMTFYWYFGDIKKRFVRTFLCSKQKTKQFNFLTWFLYTECGKVKSWKSREIFLHMYLSKGNGSIGWKKCYDSNGEKIVALFYSKAVETKLSFKIHLNNVIKRSFYEWWHLEKGTRFLYV